MGIMKIKYNIIKCKMHIPQGVLYNCIIGKIKSRNYIKFESLHGIDTLPQGDIDASSSVNLTRIKRSAVNGGASSQ